MGEIWKGDALTVGQLRKALEGLADDVEVGSASLNLVGYVEKVTMVALVRKDGILIVSTDKHAETFTEEELSKDDYEVLVKL